MISIDDHPPPDPSSSHHHLHHQQQQQQIPHDLKVSDIDLKSPDADLDDTNNQLLNFSIRDYVFGLRSKDVACNWPFSPTSFQLCLKHGVKNLLPPFQSLDLLRNNSSVNSLPNEVTVSSFDEKPRNDQFKSNCEQVSESVTPSTNSSCSKRNNESQFHIQEHLLHTKPKEKNTENIRKSKLVMRLNPGVELVEEIAMASKICPVCKIFSSSSNTTLNAHIDQCLTGEGTMKWTHDNPKVIVKHRVKPRKTRLMVEIYKTAPRCTIEELDRRNGTSWATNSNFPAQEFQFDQGEEEQEEEEEKEKEEEEEKEKEEEKQEPRTTAINREVADNEGDVYIDTDGTKVRILSVPKSGSLDNNHGNQKLIKGGKFVIGKKKFKSHLHKQKHHKYLKLSPNVKKLCSPKPQVRSGQKEDVAMPITENCSKDEQPRKPVNNPLSDLGIVRPPWACSKRTNLTGKRKHTKNLLIESDKSSSQCDLGRSTPLSSDDMVLSQSRKKTRTSSPLKVELRKESTSMHDDSESSPDSLSPSENSDHTRTKGSKFLRKMKSSSVIGSKEEITSNEEESSVGVETADVDKHALPDVQSVRNEPTLPNLEHVSVVPPNFTGLSNSFDPEFSKCVEMYQEQLLCSTNRAPDVEEKHDFIFHEDDPIPIPGPPGSFLPPSPGGDMVSEEQLQANSSSTTTTTTRIPTTDQNNHNDAMDRDSNSMSNSPVSTVSNPSLARSDSRSTSVVQDDTKSFPISFKTDQPCCCSRKDTAFSYNQESNKNSTPSSFNLIRSETAIFPTMKKLPVYSDHNNKNDSVASPPKPVLRLMGKNLTVDKTDDDDVSPSSQQFRPPPQPPVIFSQYQNGSESQRFNVYPPVNMTSHGGFMVPVDRYGHAAHYLGHMGHTVPQARSHHGHNNNEIIIIDNDDLPENETLRRNRGQINPLYTMYQAQNSGHMYSGGGGGGSGSGGSSVFRGGSFNGDLGKWNVGGSSSSPSRATSHMRSSTSYYPSSYP